LAIIVYGIKNCDTVKKARLWLDGHGIAYEFHDFKSAGIQPAKLQQWCRKAGWETLLNRAGTTFRKLSERDKKVADAAGAIALMQAQPSMIKRPVLESEEILLVGFKPEVYESNLAGKR